LNYPRPNPRAFKTVFPFFITEFDRKNFNEGARLRFPLIIRDVFLHFLIDGFVDYQT
jgi:hypothetical protein